MLWSLDKPRFLIGSFSPRIIQTACCLRSRWQQYRNSCWKSDSKVNTEKPNNMPPIAPCFYLSLPGGPTRRVGVSAIPCPVNPSTVHDASKASADKDVTVDLDYEPSLGPFREVLCVVAPVLLVALMYVATLHLHGGVWLVNLASALLTAALVSLSRAVWLEKSYKERERAFAALGDADSRFWPISTAAESGGDSLHAGGQLVVHVKVKVGDLTEPPPCDGTEGDTTDAYATSETGSCATSPLCGDKVNAQVQDSVTAVHCYHGFGANLGSYKRVQEQLAEVLRGVVTAHDMPGFGLTQRPSDIASYFLPFNGRLGRLVMDYELRQLGLLSQGASEYPGNSSGQAGDASKKVLAAAAPKRGQGNHLVQGKASVPSTPSQAGSPTASSTIVAPHAGGLTGGAGALYMTLGSTGVGSISADSGVVQPRAIKRILIGHSLGGACSSLEAVANSDGLAGLVLVAPAVLALPGPEYQDVTLSPNRPDGTCSVTGGSITSDVAAARAKAATRTAAVLGCEPHGSRVTDPPEVRRLYPVGRMPVHTDKALGGGGDKAGPARRGARVEAVLRASKSLLLVMTSVALLTVLRLLTPVITLLLRSLVRQRTFWLKGLQQAYYNPGAVTADIVDSYRLPQLVSGWEIGLVRFLLARLTRPKSTLGELIHQATKLIEPVAMATTTMATTAAAAATATKSAASAAVKSSALMTPSAADPFSPKDSSDDITAFESGGAAGGGINNDDDGDLATRLSMLVSKKGLPVLIIHGLYDKLVPASNSQRLARMLPGCELVLLDKCGHMPQEELPGIFVNLVAEFAARLKVGGGATEVRRHTNCAGLSAEE